MVFNLLTFHSYESHYCSYIFFLISFSSFSQNNPDAISGKWITITGNYMVEVYKQNTEYKAKVIWVKEGKNIWKTIEMKKILSPLCAVENF